MSEQPMSKHQAYRAVSNYLSNELGIDRNYIEALLEKKIDERNPEQLVLDAISKYFNKGPNGWRCEDIVRERVNAVIDKHVGFAMESGVKQQLQSTIQEHVQQITNSCQTLPEIKTTGYIINIRELEARLNMLPESKHPTVVVDGQSWYIKTDNETMSPEKSHKILRNIIPGDYRSSIVIRDCILLIE